MIKIEIKEDGTRKSGKFGNTALFEIKGERSVISAQFLEILRTMERELPRNIFLPVMDSFLEEMIKERLEGCNDEECGYREDNDD